MGLFGFYKDGRKDTSREIIPTSDGYDEWDKQFSELRANGKNVDVNDPDLKKAAARHGVTPEFYRDYYGR